METTRREDMSAWSLVATVGSFEYWQCGSDVFRRRVSDRNVMACDGAPMGARWEGSRAWFDQYVVHNNGRLS